jgi:hypothetical protein
MKTIQMLIALLVLVVFGLSAQAVSAAQVTTFSVSLSDSRPTTPSDHTYAFTHTSGGTLASITFSYCTTPSGTCVKPSVTTNVINNFSIANGLTQADWTTNAAGTQPRLVIKDENEPGEVITAGAIMNITLSNITNHAIDSCQPGGDQSTDTCYLRLATYSDSAGSNLVDEGIASYSVVDAVVVTARVDPIFTFTVSSVGESTVNNGITTSVASTYNTLPFGNLTAGTPKYAAHRLNVTTNTQSGYTVSARMLTQMTGVYTQNNIDPFAATGVGWSTPLGWTEPTGQTPNDNTGWIGANTTDTDVSGWNTTPQQKFGPVSSTANNVMRGLASDNGTTGIFVTYAIEANVFQPADTYTGTLIYNALPIY